MSSPATQHVSANFVREHSNETVSGFRAWAVSLPLAHRLHHATADVTALTSVIAEVELSDGTKGYAEVRTNGAYATGEDETTVVGALRAASPIGKTQVEVVDSLGSRSKLATMAVDTALWDAVARRGGVPLYRAWNPIAAEVISVRTHGQIGFGDRAAAQHSARAFVAKGFDRIKVRVGSPDLAVDIGRLEGIREAVGPEVRLIVDANGGWSYDTAARGIEAMAGFGLDWVEQPVMAVADMARLRRISGTPIYADESVRDAHSVEKLIAADAVDGVHLKLEKSGTAARLMQTVARAKVNEIAVTLGQMDQGRLGCAVTAHLAAALGLDRAELWGWANVTRDLTDVVRMREGCVVIPPGPGLGIPHIDTSFAQEIL